MYFILHWNQCCVWNSWIEMERWEEWYYVTFNPHSIWNLKKERRKETKIRVKFMFSCSTSCLIFLNYFSSFLFLLRLPNTVKISVWRRGVFQLCLVLDLALPQQVCKWDLVKPFWVPCYCSVGLVLDHVKCTLVCCVWNSWREMEREEDWYYLPSSFYLESEEREEKRNKNKC